MDGWMNWSFNSNDSAQFTLKRQELLSNEGKDEAFFKLDIPADGSSSWILFQTGLSLTISVADVIDAILGLEQDS